MKKLLLFTLCLLPLTPLVAQSFMFYRGNQPLEDNAEFAVSDYEVFFEEDDYSIFSLESGLVLKNISNTNVQATVTQTIIENALDNENGYLNFCFLSCYTGNTNRIMNGEIPANSISMGYHVNFFVYKGFYNRIKVRYEVYRTNDLSKNDKKTVTVTYVYDKNSVNKIEKTDIISKLNIFQEGSHIRFNCNFNSEKIQLEIYNLTGQRMAVHHIPSGNVSFTLPETLSKGVYFCVIRGEKLKITSKKFRVI